MKLPKVIENFVNKNEHFATGEGLCCFLFDAFNLLFQNEYPQYYPEMRDKELLLEFVGLSSSDYETLKRRAKINSPLPKHFPPAVQMAYNCLADHPYRADQTLFTALTSNIRTIQRNAGISGIRKVYYSLRDMLYTQHVPYPYITPTKADIPILESERGDTLLYFLKVVYALPAYTLYEGGVPSDGKLSKYLKDSHFVVPYGHDPTGGEPLLDPPYIYLEFVKYVDDILYLNVEKTTRIVATHLRCL